MHSTRICSLPTALIVGILFFIAQVGPNAAADDPGTSSLQGLLKERLTTLREVARQMTVLYRDGAAPLERLRQATQALAHAELDMCASDKERIAVLETVVTQARNIERMAEVRFKAGLAMNNEVLWTKADRLGAEIALTREKSKASAGAK